MSKPCTPGEHQNSWYSKWMFIPLKMVLMGIDPYPICRSTPVDWRWNRRPLLWRLRRAGTAGGAPKWGLRMVSMVSNEFVVDTYIYIYTHIYIYICFQLSWLCWSIFLGVAHGSPKFCGSSSFSHHFPPWNCYIWGYPDPKWDHPMVHITSLAAWPFIAWIPHGQINQ